MAYDDDEENPPVGFEQDPEEDELGTGTWIYADGSRKYGKGDAAEAKSFLKKEPRPALPSGAPLNENEKSALQATPDELARLEGNGGRSLDETFLASTTGAEAEDAAEASELPKPLGGANPEPARAGNDSLLSSAAAPAPGAPRVSLPGAKGPARYTDHAEASDSVTSGASQSSSTSTTGSAQPREQFDAQQAQLAQSYGQSIQDAGAGAQSQADAILKRRDALMQMAADKEAATSAAIAQRDARAKAATDAITKRAAVPIDHNKLWKDKGALGTTLGLLGVALRSLTATKFGGPNTALQSIQEQRKQNIQAQMDDRDSELRGLERELGSLDAAVPVLEARMRDAEIKRIDGMLANERSQEVLANGEKLKSQLMIERDGKLADASKAYFGTLSTQQAQQSQASRTQGQAVSREQVSGAGVGDKGGGKSGADLYDDMLKRDKEMEERGATDEQRQAMWDAVGLGKQRPSGETAPARTNREQAEKVGRDEANMSEDQAKAEAALDSLLAYGDDAGLKRDKNDEFEDPGFLAGSVKPGWAEPVKEFAGRPTPVKDSRKVAAQAIGRLVSGGVIGKDEGEDLLQMVGDENASRAQIASRLNKVKRLVVTRRKANRRDAPTGPRGKPIEAEP